MKEEQFRTEYKKAADTMVPDEEMKHQLENKLRAHGMKRPRKMVYIAASIVLAAGIGLAAPVLWQQVNGPAAPDNPGDRQVITDTSPVISTGSVTIPKMELPDMNSGAAMDMIGLVVYQGNIYTQTATRIEAADAAALRGSKLGQTTGGIDEWSGKDKYIELASTIGETDIYAVKGYDPDFRIMSYKEINGEVYAELYEHMNGITVGSGADLLGKLNLEGRIASAEWESFQSWNNGLQQYAPLANDGTLASFIADLLEAQPVDAQSLMKEHIYDDEDRKVIYLKLEDNTRVELTLFGKGLVRYGNAPVFFVPESGTFQAFWESMHPL